jgi:diaminopimelate epimerase
MGTPRFAPEDIPVRLDHRGYQRVGQSIISYPVDVNGMALTLNLVSMGNPHAVFFQQQSVAKFPLSEIGPGVENLDIFVNRTNFEVVRVMSSQSVEARVWERGVGETLACGSGACAIIAVGQALGYLEKKVEVQVPGGVLSVEWNGKGEVLLSGPAEIVYTGKWPEEV